MRKRQTTRAREEAGQLRLLPSAAEVRRLRQAEKAGESRQCWQCRMHKPIARVNDHPETAMAVCDTCWEDHPKRYDAWLTRRTKADEKETGS